jgi:hypothetical protein
MEILQLSTVLGMDSQEESSQVSIPYPSKENFPLNFVSGAIVTFAGVPGCE